MESNSLLYLAEHFRVLRLRFTLQLQDNWQLPAFKGSMLHGWLGQVTRQVDGQLFQILFAEHDAGQPKPYALKLSDDHKTQWQKHELLTFDVMLFGEATSLAERLIDAVTQTTLGIGDRQHNARCGVRCLSAVSVLPHQQLPGVVLTPLSDWLDMPMGPDSCELALHLKSPLRLKTQGKVNPNLVPDLYLLIKQVCRRLTLLSQYWVIDDEDLLFSIRAQQPRFGKYDSSSHLYFENWQRYSMTLKKPISFGGLKGQLSFYGDIAPAKHWLQVGAVLGMGGKTTFGLGHYELIG